MDLKSKAMQKLGPNNFRLPQPKDRGEDEDLRISME